MNIPDVGNAESLPSLASVQCHVMSDIEGSLLFVALLSSARVLGHPFSIHVSVCGIALVCLWAYHVCPGAGCFG